MKKKIFAMTVGAIVLAFALALTGCGGNCPEGGCRLRTNAQGLPQGNQSSCEEMDCAVNVRAMEAAFQVFANPAAMQNLNERCNC